MFIKQKLVTLLSLILPLGTVSAQVPTLKVDGGEISGVAGAEAGMAVYKGIPYAAPPAGNENPSEDKTSKISLLTQSVMEHSCIAYVENATEAQKADLRTVQWFVDCGDDDFLLDRNIEFFHAMRGAGIPLQFRIRDGGHTSEYWHSGLYNVLRFVSRCFE